MDFESLLKNTELKKWIVGGVAVIVSIFIVREVVLGVFVNEIFGKVTANIEQQQKSIQSLDNKANQVMKEIENGMQNQMKEMSDERKQMDVKMGKFHQDFAEGVARVQSELAKGRQYVEELADAGDKMIMEGAEQDRKEHEKDFDEMFNHKKP